MYPQAFNKEAALVRISAAEISDVVNALEGIAGDNGTNIAESFRKLQGDMANLATKEIEVVGVPSTDDTTSEPDPLDPLGRFARWEERHDDLAKHRIARPTD